MPNISKTKLFNISVVLTFDIREKRVRVKNRPLEQRVQETGSKKTETEHGSERKQGCQKQPGVLRAAAETEPSQPKRLLPKTSATRSCRNAQTARCTDVQSAQMSG